MATVVHSVHGAVAQVALRAEKMTASLSGMERDGVNAAAFLVKNAVADRLGGNSILLSGVGRKGAKVGVRYDIKGTKNPTALVYAFGPFHLIERDTSKHVIEAKKRRRKKNLGIGGGKLSTESGWAARVNHPGTKGKHPFERGVEWAKPRVVQVYATGVNRAARKAFS